MLNKHDDVSFEAIDEEGASKSAGTKLKKMREELATIRAERDEYLTLLQRSRADYANLQREEADRQKSARVRSQSAVFQSLLPVLDSFDAAMKNHDVWEAVDHNWRIGVEYIYSQLQKLLEEYQVNAVAVIGAGFDPAIHEPVEYRLVDDPEMADTVIEIVSQGYRMDGILLRPAKVIIGKVESIE